MTNLWNVIRRRRALAIVIGVVLTLGLGTSAFAVGRQFYTPDSSPKAANASNETNKTDAKPAGFSEFRSDQAAFEMAYPSNWTKLVSKDPQVLLLLAQGTQDALQVRLSEFPEAIGPQQVPIAQQALTDKLTKSDKSIEMITPPKQIEQGGLPGFVLLYNFKDSASGQQGVHYHFVLFNGKKMYTIVFQTLPKERLSSSAPTFEKIINSFHALKA